MNTAICQSIYLSTHLFMFLSIFIYQYIYLSCLSIYHQKQWYLNPFSYLALCINLSVYLSIYLSIWPFIYLIIYLSKFVYLSLSPSSNLCISIHQSIYIYLSDNLTILPKVSNTTRISRHMNPFLYFNSSVYLYIYIHSIYLSNYLT